MTLITSWTAAIPPLLLAIGLLLAPGAVVAAALGFRTWDALGLAPMASIGILGLADAVSIVAGAPWGLRVILLTTGVAAVVAAAVSMATPRFINTTRKVLGGRVHSEEHGWLGSIDGPPPGHWTRAGNIVAVASTLAAGVVTAVLISRGIGSPSAIAQTVDATTHVNGIAAVAAHRSDAPSVFHYLSNPKATGGFYPPLFHGVAACLVLYAHADPFSAANLTGVAIAAVWPLSIGVLVRQGARATPFGYSVAMAGSLVVLLFPTLMLSYGILWPNGLSILALPGCLVLVARTMHYRPTSTAGWWTPPGRGRSGVLLVGILPGLVLAHPGAAFALLYLSAPLLALKLWNIIARAATAKARFVRGLVIVTAVVVACLGTWLRIRSIPMIATVRAFTWNVRESVSQGVGEVVMLAAAWVSPCVPIAVMALMGLALAARRPWQLWLACDHALVGVLAVMTAAVQLPWTKALTGFWYNDSFRLFALLPLTALPLAATGAEALRNALELWWVRRRGKRPHVRPRTGWISAVVAPSTVSAVVVAVVLVAAQKPVGYHGETSLMRTVYVPSAGQDQLVSPPEAAMFRRLAHEGPPGTAIAGDPFTGEVYAGLLSERPSIFPSFTVVGDPDRTLLQKHFRDFRQNPAVCAAVKRLNVGIVTSDKHIFDQSASSDPYPGFADLGSVQGLTQIDSSGDGAVAYAVGSCSS